MSEQAPNNTSNHKENTRDGEISYDQTSKRFRVRGGSQQEASYFPEDKILEHYGHKELEPHNGNERTSHDVERYNWLMNPRGEEEIKADLAAQRQAQQGKSEAEKQSSLAQQMLLAEELQFIQSMDTSGKTESADDSISTTTKKPQVERRAVWSTAEDWQDDGAVSQDIKERLDREERHNELYEKYKDVKPEVSNKDVQNDDSEQEDYLPVLADNNAKPEDDKALDHEDILEANRVKGMNYILNSEEAEEVFAKQGERAYQEHVKNKYDAIFGYYDQQTQEEKEPIVVGSDDKDMKELEPGHIPKELTETTPDRTPEAPESPDIDTEKWGELTEALNKQRTLYAELSAKQRSKNMFGVGEELEEARTAYQKAVNDIVAFEKQLIPGNTSKEKHIEIASQAAIKEIQELTKEIYDKSQELAGNEKYKKFFDVWRKGVGEKVLSKAGIKRLAKGVAVSAGLGVAVGTGMGFLGAGLGMAMTAGATAGGLRGAFRGKALNHDLIKQNAEEDINSDFERAKKNVLQALQKEGKWSSEGITDITDDTNKNRLNENRRRILGKTAVHSLTGVAGGAIGFGLSEALTPDVGATPPDHLDGGTPPVELTPPPEAPSVPIESNPFLDIINNGDGLTQSIIDHAQVNWNGLEIPKLESFEIFQQLQNEGLITPEHITNISPMDVQGNVGYVAPGESVWDSTVMTRLDEIIRQRYGV